VPGAQGVGSELPSGQYCPATHWPFWDASKKGSEGEGVALEEFPPQYHPAAQRPVGAVAPGFAQYIVGGQLVQLLTYPAPTPRAARVLLYAMYLPSGHEVATPPAGQ